MSIIVDLIVIGVLVLFIFLGYKRGLAGSILKILSFLIAIAIAFIFYKPVANYVIEHTTIDETIEQSIRSTFISQEAKEIEAQEEKNMPDVIVDHINQAVEGAADEAKNTIINETARSASLTIVNAGSAIILFIIAKILLVIVKLFTNFVTELPILKQIDKTGGIIYGVIEGLVLIYVIFAIIAFISPMIGKEIVETINHSMLANIMYNNNLLLKIIF